MKYWKATVARALPGGQTSLVFPILLRDLKGDDNRADKKENPLQLRWDRSRRHSVGNHERSKARGRKRVDPSSFQNTQERCECPVDDRPVVPVHAISNSGLRY